MKPLTRVAPAKVNLFLHLTGRRPDGYHLIDSLFVFTEGGDTVYLQDGPVFSFSLDGRFAGALKNVGGAGDGNLMVRAARLLAREVNRDLTVHMRLDKELPVAAGLGGGSSDAATVLTALSDWWGLDMDPKRLGALALSLGADVPACLSPHPQRVAGIGEICTPARVDMPPHILLVNPGLPLATPDVFRAYRHSDRAFAAVLEDVPVWDMDRIARDTVNGLTDAALACLPSIADMLDILAALNGARLTRLSGSGPTCFVLFDSAETAAAAAADLGRKYPGWWLWPDRLRLDRVA